jgi:acyl-CoA synthetase (AMP-forming)/AMP-acid ligase II
MSFASPFPDVRIPSVGVYGYLFDGISETDAARVALVDAKTGASTTYRELIDAVDAFAGAMAARGLGVGDVVALLAPNSPAFAIAFHGILRSGATATTVNALFTPAEIAKQLTDSKAALLVTVEPMLERARAAADVVGLAQTQVVTIGSEDLVPGPAPDVNFDPATHLAVLPYSSGTTGNPKGVMLTHRNLVSNVAQIRPLQGMVPDDVIIAVLPFFHIYGMTVLLNAALHARARLLIMPAFDLGEFLANIAEYRCTQAFIAPPVAVALAKHPLVDTHDLSSLHTVMCGAAPLDEDLGHEVEARLGRHMVQGYGMSEASPVTHIIPFDGGKESVGVDAPLSSCGWTLPNAETKIVDPDTGAEVEVPETGRSAPGELWFKGPNVMAGYLGNEKATAETIDAEGFLHTGDLACADATGCIFIVDRLKELIKYKGYQVPPAELEALLLSHPDIADAAVVGVIDTESGEEVPKAFVVKQSDAALNGAEVMEFVAGQVAPYKKVRQVEFIDAVPKSASGKILRKDLRTR